MLKRTQRIAPPFVSIALLLGNAAIATALEPGIYWGGGSRYIQIAQQGDRFCYHGFSPNGSTVASLLPNRSQPGLYHVYGMKGATLSQSSARTLWFGAAQYSYDSNSRLSSQLQQCLNSPRLYFQQERFRR